MIEFPICIQPLFVVPCNALECGQGSGPARRGAYMSMGKAKQTGQTDGQVARRDII